MRLRPRSGTGIDSGAPQNFDLAGIPLGRLLCLAIILAIACLLL
jgi:hypothetical protein